MGLHLQRLVTALQQRDRLTNGLAITKSTGSSKMHDDLKSKVAVVTGGARDIGRAISLGLAEAGASVAVNYNSSADAAKKVVDEITAKGGKAIAIRADVSTPQGAEQLIADACAAFGDKIDVLVN